MTQIIKQNFKQLHQLTPKRIYLPNNRVLKKYIDNSQYYGMLNFPFKETIKVAFERDTKLILFDNKKDAYNKTSIWRSIETEDEFNTVEKWIKAQGTTVFIRSLLSSCIALDVNVDYINKVKTEIGDLEDKAKLNQDENAIGVLVNLVCKKIKNAYKEGFYIAAVPANKSKEFDLPTLLAKKVAEKLGWLDITDDFAYKNLKQALKSISIDEKWQELEQSSLVFKRHNLANKPIILIDDKYQSGTTLHYVASKLQQAGFNTIYGLTIIKTMKDDDNQ